MNVVENKYIPVKYNGLYYIFDALNRWNYPCTENIYNLFCEKSYQQILSMYSSGNCDVELMKFVEILSVSNQVNSYYLYSYPQVKRQDVVLSLAKVPHIVLELTQKCNLACVYCCYGSLYKQGKITSKQSSKNIIGYLQTLLTLRMENHINTPFRLSFYGGEPLLCMHTIKECVSLVSSMMHNVNVSYGITTNGALLDKNMEYLVEHKFHVLISLDGNKYNNQYRIYKNGKESFYDVLKNIRRLYSMYPIFFKENVEFSTVLHGKSNYMDAISFFSQWNKLPIFSPVINIGVRKNIGKYQEVWNLHNYSSKEIEVFKKTFPKEYYKLFPAVNGKSYLWLKEITALVDSVDEVLYDEYKIYPGNNCVLFSSKVFVAEDGKIYLCEKVSRKFVFGKLTEGNVLIYLKRINRYYAEITQIFQSKCLGCYKSCGCNCCFFAEREKVESKKCFCDKAEACSELHNMLNEN